MDFKALRKNSAANFAKTLDQTKDMKKGGFEQDPELWYPGVDKAGNGFARIRFLPQISEDDVPYVRWWNHSFKNADTGKWYIEMSRTSLGKDQKDPVGELNTKLWNSSKDENHPNRKQASKQSRRVNFQCNIYIIEDQANPTNNGTVKKFKFGKALWDKVEVAMFPPEGRESERFNPFDLWDGANFRIDIFSKQTSEGKQRDYSRSRFEDAKGPFATDKEMEAVYKQISGNENYSLKGLLDEGKFKSNEMLKKRLDEVLGFDSSMWTAAGVTQLLQERPPVAQAATPRQTQPTTVREAPDETEIVTEDGDSEFFASLEQE